MDFYVYYTQLVSWTYITICGVFDCEAYASYALIWKGNGYRVSSSGHRLYRVFKPIWKFSGPQAPRFYFWVSTRDFEKQPLASEIGSNWIIFSNLRGMNKNMFKASPQVTNISWKKYVSRMPWYNLKIKDKRYERFLDPLNLQQLPCYAAIVRVESQDYPKKNKNEK